MRRRAVAGALKKVTRHAALCSTFVLHPTCGPAEMGLPGLENQGISVRFGGQGRNRPCIDFASLTLGKSMVAKGGIEPPTQGFSVLCSTD
jgi:hypothetical protein